jgi:glycosyltransferase involved in cell wall biosynthesis
MSVSLTVLIPTPGRPRLLERTLAPVARCTLPDGYEELVVIENGSMAGAKELVEDLPKELNARYMHRGRGNKSYALNEALQTITGGLVVFFDDDVRVHKNTLKAYAHVAVENGTGKFFGGPVRIDWEEKPPDWMMSLYPYSVRGYDAAEMKAVDMYLGFNWAAFADDLKRLGGFDPKFGPGSPAGATGQEGDMQARMRTDGMTGLDVPGAIVSHYVPRDRKSIPWLIKRRNRDERRRGMRTDASAGAFAWRVGRNTLVALGVALKGGLLWDYNKLLFGICNVSREIGAVQGYFWKSKQGQS